MIGSASCKLCTSEGLGASKIILKLLVIFQYSVMIVQSSALLGNLSLHLTCIRIIRIRRIEHINSPLFESMRTTRFVF